MLKSKTVEDAAVECAGLIRNALNESVANGTSPEMKLLKLASELEMSGKPHVSSEAPAGSDPEHVLVVSGEPADDAVEGAPKKGGKKG